MSEWIDAWSAASDDMRAAYREACEARDAAQAELADLRRQLEEARVTMADMRRAEYARVREEYPPGRTAIIPPDVSGSMTVAQVADAEDYPELDHD